MLDWATPTASVSSRLTPPASPFEGLSPVMNTDRCCPAARGVPTKITACMGINEKIVDLCRFHTFPFDGLKKSLGLLLVP